jgi:hypothetical protein
LKGLFRFESEPNKKPVEAGSKLNFECNKSFVMILDLHLPVEIAFSVESKDWANPPPTSWPDTHSLDSHNIT